MDSIRASEALDSGSIPDEATQKDKAGKGFVFFIEQKLAVLRERSELLRNQQINQENYKRTLNEVILVFNKLDSSTSKPMVESELSDKLNALRNAASIEDSTASQKLNQMVFGLVNEYRNARFKLFDLKDFEQEIRKKNEKIQELGRDPEDCRGRANFNRIP